MDEYDSWFFTIECPSHTYIFNQEKIEYIDYNKTNRFLVIGLSNGTKFEFEEVKNLKEIARCFGLPLETFQLRMVEEDNEEND